MEHPLQGLYSPKTGHSTPLLPTKKPNKTYPWWIGNAHFLPSFSGTERGLTSQKPNEIHPLGWGWWGMGGSYAPPKNPSKNHPKGW